MNTKIKITVRDAAASTAVEQSDQDSGPPPQDLSHAGAGTDRSQAEAPAPLGLNEIGAASDQADGGPPAPDPEIGAAPGTHDAT